MRFKWCEECGGSGSVEYEVPIIDYYNGGYLDVKTEDCEACGGGGQIEDTAGEDGCEE